MRRLWCGVLAAGLLGLCLGCGGEKRKSVSVIGSNSIHLFAEMLAEEFNKNNPDIHVEVQAGGSTAGIQAVANGVADIGMSSRTLKPEETGFTPITIARDGIALVVHRTNKVTGLTRAQFRGIFEGAITNWKDVGGEDKAIHPITREEGSGTRATFEDLVMGKARIAASVITQEASGTIREMVENDPSALGYLSVGLVGQKLTTLAVDGVTPSHADVLSGKYPLARPFFFVVKGTPGQAAQKFIDFVLSPAAQQMLEKEGLVRVK